MWIDRERLGMAYRHDSDGPVIDRDLFKAKSIAKAGVWTAVCIIVLIAIWIIFPKDKRIENTMDFVRLELKNSPYNYSLENTEGELIVTIWASGITSRAKKAYNGDVEALQEWEKTKNNILKYIYDIRQYMLIEEVEEITLTVMLVNEDNRSRSLLVYKDGVLSYDVVSDVGKN
ncbi:MAG: hypothetical protein IK014_03240 [Lachnospiraceae bacterium]|nr:hypothetical protein [Lachnospiraceae bacterium]